MKSRVSNFTRYTNRSKILFQFENFLNNNPPVDQDEQEYFLELYNMVLTNRNWLDAYRNVYSDWFDEHIEEFY